MRKEKGKEGERRGVERRIHVLWPVTFDYRRALLKAVRQPITSETSCWAPACFHRMFIESQKK